MQTILRAAARRAKVARVRSVLGQRPAQGRDRAGAGSQLVPRRCTLTALARRTMCWVFARRMNTSVEPGESSIYRAGYHLLQTISTIPDVALPNAMLKEIRQAVSRKTLSDRWQEMFGIYLQLQVHVSILLIQR